MDAPAPAHDHLFGSDLRLEMRRFRAVQLRGVGRVTVCLDYDCMKAWSRKSTPLLISRLDITTIGLLSPSENNVPKIDIGGIDIAYDLIGEGKKPP